MSESELKPCPFCGGKVKINIDMEQTKDPVCAFICESCGSITYMDELIDKQKSIEAWNTRPNPWHTGTPIDEIKENDWYTFAYKWNGEIRYITVKEPSFWYFTNCDTLAWQKVEPYKEKS